MFPYLLSGQFARQLLDTIRQPKPQPSLPILAFVRRSTRRKPSAMPTLVYHSTEECPDKKQTSPTYLVKDTTDCSMLWLTNKRKQPNPTFTSSEEELQL